MNEKKWKTTGKTEILDEDFLNALSIEIQKKYPNNTKKQNLPKIDIEILEDTQSKEEDIEILNDKIEKLEENYKSIKKEINGLKINQKTDRKKQETIEILNDQLEELTKTTRKIENSIEILTIDDTSKKRKKNQEQIEILNDKLEELSTTSEKIGESIEILSDQEPTKKEKESIEILSDQLEELSITSKKIKDDIEILTTNAKIKQQQETIEILEDRLEEFSKKKRNLDDTIELLKIDFPSEKNEKKEQIEILNDRLEELSDPENLEDTLQFFKIDEDNIELLEEEITTFKNPSENLENTIELLDIVKPEKPIQVKNKIKPKKKPWIILLCICTIIIGFIIYKAFFWQRDSIKTNYQIEQIVKTTKTKETFIKKENIVGAATEEDDRYFNYLDVDFQDLVKENNEVQGWIKVNNTNINYPFVQTKDNDFYLKHSFNKKYNTAGWVFADFRNHFDKFDQNTILYAHGRLDNTMFGSLKKVVEKNWYENMENEFLQLTTLESKSIWQVFSVYTIEPETYYITPNFETDDEYQLFLDTLTARSAHDFQVELNKKDKILTLSSCYNDTLRVVLHAKLVNIEKTK